MKQNGLGLWLTAGFAAVVAGACAGSQAGSSTSTTGMPAPSSTATPGYSMPGTPTTAGGDVASRRSSGMWVDSAAGTWMDTTGALWTRSSNGSGMSMMPSDVAGMSDANIVAHLTMGDSLEVALSQTGATRAEHNEVRDFAQRMVKEHTAHMQSAMTAAGSVIPSRADTADARMASSVITQLTNAHAGADYDKKFMRAEVMMHQHMLNDLITLRPNASGATQQLIDSTIPVVRKHLRDAQTILADVLDDPAGSKRGGTLKPPTR